MTNHTDTTGQPQGRVSTPAESAVMAYTDTTPDGSRKRANFRQWARDNPRDAADAMESVILACMGEAKLCGEMAEAVKFRKLLGDRVLLIAWLIQDDTIWPANSECPLTLLDWVSKLTFDNVDWGGEPGCETLRRNYREWLAGRNREVDDGDFVVDPDPKNWDDREPREVADQPDNTELADGRAIEAAMHNRRGA